MRILIADDDPNARMLLEVYTRDQPWDVEFCADGQQALERIRTADIDIVVSDIRMPGLSGDELLKHIKQERPELPVVLMTAHTSTDDVVEMMKLGADDYISKPFEKDSFLHRIRKSIEGMERRRENARLRGELEQLRDRDHAATSQIIGNSSSLRA
ncbi:MAG: response regulator, partial [Deltaproteobacteria bacterium]|nr:response regulator [Deltaproteobacteria bacterium]